MQVFEVGVYVGLFCVGEQAGGDQGVDLVFSALGVDQGELVKRICFKIQEDWTGTGGTEKSSVGGTAAQLVK